MSVAAALSERFGWADVTVRAHDTGMNSRTWLVETGTGRYVAKWVPEAQHAGFVAGLEAAALAGAPDLPTGEAVPDRDHRLALPWNDGMLAVLTMVDGAELDGESPDHAGWMGATLARAHRQLAGHAVDGAPRVGSLALDLGGETLSRDAPVQRAVISVVDEFCALAPSLTSGTCHGDPAPEAFVDTGSSIGLIDWGSCMVGALLYDLASAVMYLGGPEHAAPFVAAYAHAGGPVGHSEMRAHLESVLRYRWAVQAEYFAWRLANDDRTGIESDAGNHQGFSDARQRLLHWY